MKFRGAKNIAKRAVEELILQKEQPHRLAQEPT